MGNLAKIGKTAAGKKEVGKALDRSWENKKWDCEEKTIENRKNF